MTSYCDNAILKPKIHLIRFITRLKMVSPSKTKIYYLSA